MSVALRAFCREGSTEMGKVDYVKRLRGESTAECDVPWAEKEAR